MNQKMNQTIQNQNKLYNVSDNLENTTKKTYEKGFFKNISRKFTAIAGSLLLGLMPVFAQEASSSKQENPVPKGVYKQVKKDYEQEFSFYDTDGDGLLDTFTRELHYNKKFLRKIQYFKDVDRLQYFKDTDKDGNLDFGVQISGKQQVHIANRVGVLEYFNTSIKEQNLDPKKYAVHKNTNKLYKKHITIPRILDNTYKWEKNIFNVQRAVDMGCMGYLLFINKKYKATEVNPLKKPFVKNPFLCMGVEIGVTFGFNHFFDYLYKHNKVGTIALLTLVNLLAFYVTSQDVKTIGIALK